MTKTNTDRASLAQSVASALCGLFQRPGAPRYGQRCGAWLKLQTVCTRLSEGCADEHTRPAIADLEWQAERENRYYREDAPKFDENFFGALRAAQGMLRAAGL